MQNPNRRFLHLTFSSLCLPLASLGDLPDAKRAPCIAESIKSPHIGFGRSFSARRSLKTVWRHLFKGPMASMSVIANARTWHTRETTRCILSVTS